MKFHVEKLVIMHEGKTLVDIAFEIKEAFALVGQSGSGKSLTLKALLRMLPKQMQCELRIDADFLLQRGKDIAIVPQNPFTSLSPLTKIKNHFLVSKQEMKSFMEMVDLDAVFLERYPLELSGGQLQRVIIAIALSSRPKLLLLDEPTTALDSHTKETILKLIKSLQQKMGYKLLFVTHDITATAQLCDEIGVLKNGIILESGRVRDVLENPRHDYTKALIASNFKHRKKRS